MIVVASAAATAVSLPLVRRALLDRGVLDHATTRSSHVGATPRGGGLGVLVGLLVGTVAVGMFGGLEPDAPGVALIVAVGVLAGTGFLDDVRGLGALPRLVVQLAAGCGVGLAVSSGRDLWAGVLVALLSALAMVFVVNTVNFMDGINGMTAATLSGWGIVSWWAGVAYGVPISVAAGAVALGTALGFLPFNVPRAALFLGDVGSYLYGALVAATSFVMLAAGVPLLVVTAPLVPYAADVLATLARRALRRESLTEPHREHFYQVLTGPWPIGHEVVACLYGVIALGCGAVALMAPTPVVLTSLAVVFLAVAVGPHFLERLDPTSGDPA